jgi:hypothetical protein
MFANDAIVQTVTYDGWNIVDNKLVGSWNEVIVA